MDQMECKKYKECMEKSNAIIERLEREVYLLEAVASAAREIIVFQDLRCRNPSQHRRVDNLKSALACLYSQVKDSVMNDEKQNHTDTAQRIVGRYSIMEGSISGHCCFEYSVLDTTIPVIIGGKHYEDEKGKHYEAVCECFDEKSAVLICNSLNAPNAKITWPATEVNDEHK